MADERQHRDLGRLLQPGVAALVPPARGRQVEDATDNAQRQVDGLVRQAFAEAVLDVGRQRAVMEISVSSETLSSCLST
jgi:hypothetical protein